MKSVTRITGLRATASGLGLVLLLGLGFAGPVAAKGGGGGDVRVRGACSASTGWELRAKSAGGRLEVRFEVDSNRGGQPWTYTIRRDGAVTASGKRTTHGSGGSFKVERRLTAAPGTNTISATARNPKTREYCRATLTIG